MAVDTVSKRLSIMGLATIQTLPIPDAVIDQGDRQHLLLLYSGILAGAAAAGVPACRIYGIIAESRIQAVENEARVLSILQELRALNVECSS